MTVSRLIARVVAVAMAATIAGLTTAASATPATAAAKHHRPHCRKGYVPHPRRHHRWVCVKKHVAKKPAATTPAPASPTDPSSSPAPTSAPDGSAPTTAQGTTTPPPASGGTSTTPTSTTPPPAPMDFKAYADSVLAGRIFTAAPPAPTTTMALCKDHTFVYNDPSHSATGTWSVDDAWLDAVRRLGVALVSIASSNPAQLASGQWRFETDGSTLTIDGASWTFAAGPC